MLSSDRPGRRPKPTSMKLLLPPRADRPVNQNEPQPLLVLPDPPAFLGDVGKKEWRRIADALNRCNILTELDVSGLAAYCKSFELWIETERAISKCGEDPERYPFGGLLERGRLGVRANPLLAIARQAMLDTVRIATEFGMTPSSRSRVHVIPKEEDDPGERYFNSKVTNSSNPQSSSEQ